ncbi:histidine kinase [Sphingomonas oleivorans]|uniref:histidine kinase n=1 Tax=Sphingomonas oleivorans TaxID=1735121 RepID=A0A2T5G001_9SPHN|nr:histidine kinase dimerization/phosphoacceptor domain -containing protein [Sphingomonas oleivorans]PTQ12265.1 histidine kinase [Sphingomonas oleivorans]
MNGLDQGFLERLPFAANRRPLAYAVAVAISILCLALRYAIDGLIPPGYPYLTFFPAVILTAFLFGRGPGFVAALTCGFGAWLFFIPPVGTLNLDLGTALPLIFYVLVVAIDILLVHWMQRAYLRLLDERRHSARLAERTSLLFRELQHRVSNNLQVVAALLSLQKRDVADPQARAALEEAARRLALIGKIHRQLHDPNGSQIGIGPFLRQLGADLIDASGKPGIICSVEAEEAIALDPDAAVPVALIVAESMANAIEHGFADREDGHIAVRLQRHQSQVELVISDNGAGLPENFDIAGNNSLGLRIATMLARQLGGRFELFDDRGAVARLVLPV